MMVSKGMKLRKTIWRSNCGKQCRGSGKIIRKWKNFSFHFAGKKEMNSFAWLPR